MKNVKEYQLKSCIFMDTEEFDGIIKKLFGETAMTEFSLDGIWIGYEAESIDFNEISTKLAEYFDVNEIISFHMDDADEIGIWICYH